MCLLLRCVDTNTVAPFFLRLVHCKIGTGKERLRCITVLRKHRNTNTNSNASGTLFLNRGMMLHRFTYLVRNRLRNTYIGMCKNNGEFVTTQPRQYVGLAHPRSEYIGNSYKEFIAYLMAK